MSRTPHRKIVPLDELAQQLRQARAGNQTIVQCHGCFDIVHPGHVRYLQFARQLGDILIVSLTGDELVGKGPDRPYIPQELRAENLAALEFVDWVVIDPHPTACELLNTLRPDVYVKGREYADSHDPRFLREREIVENYGGRVVFHSGDVVFSSTRLIESLDDDAHLDECRLRTLCDRNGIDVRTARATLDAFHDLRVIVVGDVTRESYVLCDAREAAGDAPVLSLNKLGERHYWGGAAAVALQLRALGAQPLLLAPVGNDTWSQHLSEELCGRGIETKLFSQREHLILRTTFVADDAKLCHLTEGTTQPLDSAWEQRFIAALDAHWESRSLLVWCEGGGGAVTPNLVQELAGRARRAGLIIAGAAPADSGDIRLLRDTDLLSLTERRLRSAMHDLGAGVPSIAWRLLDHLSGKTAIVSLHKRGLIGFDGRADVEHLAESLSPPARLKSEFVPATLRQHTDLLGAEEAVLATAALTLAAGGSIPLATYLASGAAAIASIRPGRTCPTAAELGAWMESRPELRAESRFLPDAATIADIARIAPPLALSCSTNDSTENSVAAIRSIALTTSVATEEAD